MREVRRLGNGSEVAPRMLYADGASTKVLRSGMGRPGWGRGGGSRRGPWAEKRSRQAFCRWRDRKARRPVPLGLIFGWRAHPLSAEIASRTQN
jgi:hypothetical protein